MAKILVKFPAFLTIITFALIVKVCILTKIIGLLTLVAPESKIVQNGKKEA